MKWLEEVYVWRLALGLAFFATLAVHDLVRHPEDPKRCKEYLFLAYGALLAVIYAEIHDQITVSISPGYFVVFKGLGATPGHLRRETALLALKASYGPGLIAAALILIANNPSKKLEPLPYGRLARIALVPLGAAALGALGGAAVGWLHPPEDTLDLARETFREAYVRPFCLVWGIHFGSYVGAALGTLVAVALVRRSRAPLAPATIAA